MRQRIQYFCYAFVGGVAAGMLGEAPVDWVWPLYIAAVVLGLAGWGLGVAQDQGVGQVRSWMALLGVSLCAFAFGMGRYAERAFVPAFDPEQPNHIRAILEEFPDEDFKQTTRIVGKIVSEPEYRPALGKPGVVALTIEPYEVEPEPGSGQVYQVSEGAVVVFLRPSQKFRVFEREWETMFRKLADFSAYGYIVEVEAPLQIFRSADNPGLFDAEIFNTDKDVYAQASIAFWNNHNPPIKIVDETEEGSYLTELSLDLKQQMLGVIKATVPFPESAFLAGVTLGARRGLDGVRTMFEEAPELPEGADPDDPDASGDVPDLRQFVLDQFRWSGTSHVLAVSGLHVTIITGALWGLFSLMKLPPKVYAPLIVLGLAIFVLITGAAPSSTRAGIMNSLVVLTYVYLGASFRASLLLAIGVSGFFILLQNPKWLVQPAFALSFMAVLSLGLITPPTERVLKLIPGWQKMPVWVQQFIAAQFAIQLGMMGPLSAYYFCRMSIAGPIANFVAIPLIGVIVQLGLFACILGLIPYVGIYLGLVLNAANYIAVWFFLWVAHISTVIMPFPYVQTMTPPMLVGYYFLLALFIYNKPLIRTARIHYYDLVMGIGGARRRLQCLGVLGGGLAVVGAVCTVSFWPEVPDGKLHVNVLSVRYGQAIHIQTPSGAHILVDAGSNDYRTGWSTGERTVAQYLLKKRVARLDAVIMTNTSPEDFGGIAGLFKVFPVRRFYSVLPVWQWDTSDPDAFIKTVEGAVGADAAENNRNADFEDAVYLLAELTDRINQDWGLWRLFEILPLSPSSVLTDFGPSENFVVKSGMVLWQEEGENGKFEIIALHPNPEYPLTPSNNNSMVLLVRYGKHSFLLPSDITEEGIRELLRLPADLLASNVVVVPAHGSPKADVELFYKTVLPPEGGPRYAVFSTGWSTALKPPRGAARSRDRQSYRDSFLSHRQLFANDVTSGTDLLATRLEEWGYTVARTDRHGAVMMRADGAGELEVEGMLGAVRQAGTPTADEGQGEGMDARQREIP